MDLLIQDGEKMTISAEAAMIDEFNKIWKRDHGISVGGKRIKTIALKELSYVALFAKHNSPYAKTTDEIQRRLEITKDLKLGDDWVPDKQVLAAIAKYDALFNVTLSIKLLKATRRSIDKLCEFFDTVDMDERNLTNGAPLYKPIDLTGPQSKVGLIVKNLAELEEQVKKEQVLNTAIQRGNATKGDYED